MVAVAIVGAGVIGAVGSNLAAGQQAGAAQTATDTQVGMFNQVMGNLQPYQKAGTDALGALQGYLNPSETGGPGGQPGLLHQFGPTDLTNNLAPNYNFQLDQGQTAIRNQNAASGGAIGGNALTGINAFSQNFAANAYQQAYENYQTNQNNVYGRLGNLAQLGQVSSTGQASGAPMFASGISNTIQGLGNANAAGTVGTANALGGAGSNLAGYYWMNNLMGQQQTGGLPNYLNTPTLDPGVFS